MATLFLAIFILASAFALIGIRVIFKKEGGFRGTCATNNPLLTNEIGECTVCGKKPEEECKKDQPGALNVSAN